MADRYWVSGSGSWNSTTKWSTTSGGASGASVPTASDNAIFDANSGTAHYIVTVTDNATCADLTFTPHASDGVTQFAVGVNFVIAGTFSTSGTQGNRRAWFRSSTYGLMRDIQIATIGTVTDVDFRDIRVTGTGGTLTGTRIGDQRGNVGITFSAPKNCFRIGTGNWSDDQWSDTSGGTPNTDFFPLAQDTAVFDESTTGGTHTMNSAIPYTGTVDMSARTSALTLSTATAYTIYGNWINGSGVTLSGAAGSRTFSGRNTQTITSAGKLSPAGVIIDSYGGTVELADALDMGGNRLTVTNGTFDTKDFSVTAGDISSSNSNVREIKLGASTVTLAATNVITFTNATNLTFNAGTSQINCTINGSITFSGGGLTFYNVSCTTAQTSPAVITFNQENTFNNVTFTPTSGAGVQRVAMSDNQIITGTLTVAGATAVRRIFLRSNTIGTTSTLTVGTLSADDCDFRDITIAGTAAGSSPTRAGDCGGNSGLIFPAAKTVYWNLAGNQSWSSAGWAPSSGGTPDINNFPLAQDTAVFDEAGSAGTVTMDAASVWNIGTFDASARTSAMTLTIGNTFPSVYGNWTFGTGVTSSSSAGTIVFSGHGSSTITSNGVTFGCRIEVASPNRTLQLADALSLISTNYLRVSFGEFNAGIYNCTMGSFDSNNSNIRTVKMGSGTWTLTDAASPNTSVWGISATNTRFYKGTANIVLSNTSTTARIFTGGGLSYNKLTIGGATGTSTLTIAGNNQFTELASTKTVAHTIAFGSTVQTFGKWTVTGTAGNVVTLTSTGGSQILAGACTDGIDYLVMGGTAFSSISPAEFYAGANSTGTAAAPVYRTAKPADSTRYWVGGTGNWSDTARWSTSSGGAGGADLPRSHDDVVFDSASNATDYTVNVNSTTGGNRCKALTIAGPASGNVTLTGTNRLSIHDDITLPATGLTRTYTGAITLSGTGAGKTITTNGVTLLSSSITVDGVGCEWSLGGALTIGSQNLTLTNGSFDLATYNLTAGNIVSANGNSRTINFNTGTTTLGQVSPINFGATETNRANLTVIASTSQINCSSTAPTFSGNNQTFYNVSFTNTVFTAITLNGANTFNNLSVAGKTSTGIASIGISDDQTINGTLTHSAGTNATMRTFVRSNTIGTTRTLTCAAFSGTDADFRDITIAGVAAPVSGTRLGDCKGNSGITFDAAKTVYYRNTGTANWGGTGSWSATSGGTPDTNQFPLAQDTAVFPAATYPASGLQTTINADYNIGTIDMSLRTSNTMTLASTFSPSIYGDWINGTGISVSATNTITFSGRTSQTITSSGATFAAPITINSPSGSVTLQDAFASNNSTIVALIITSGTFDANDYNVTLSGSSSRVDTNNSNIRTIGIGSGTWTIRGSSTAWIGTSVNLTVTGIGIISLTSASAKIFAGGGVSYSGITLNQGGTGALTVTGNNTFANITSTATGATTINFGTTTQRVANFTATGTAGNVLTLQGTTATSPATLILTSGTVTTIDYLTITGLRAYDLSDTWYAGANSTNNGSLGWIFEAGVVGASTIFYGANNITSIFYGSTPVSAIYYGAAQVF